MSRGLLVWSERIVSGGADGIAPDRVGPVRVVPDRKFLGRIASCPVDLELVVAA